MLNIKELIEDNINEVSVEDKIYKNPPSQPYIVVNDNLSRRGSDTKNNIIEHNVIVELYSNKKKSLDSVSKQLDALFSFVEFTTNSDYTNEDKLYYIFYNFNFVEKGE